jgi:isoamylase
MVFLNGDAITEPGPRGEPVRDDTFLILLSANQDPVTFTLPGPKLGRCWAVTLDTAAGQAAEGSAAEGGAAEHRPGGQIVLAGHSMMVLRRTDPAPAAEAPEAG